METRCGASRCGFEPHALRVNEKRRVVWSTTTGDEPNRLCRCWVDIDFDGMWAGELYWYAGLETYGCDVHTYPVIHEIPW